MEHKKVVEKHIDLQTIVDHYTCDICGEVINESNGWSYTNIEIKKGFSCDGDYSAQEFDMCEDCWGYKLIPWFKSLGAVPREVY